MIKSFLSKPSVIIIQLESSICSSVPARYIHEMDYLLFVYLACIWYTEGTAKSVQAVVTTEVQRGPGEASSTAYAATVVKHHEALTPIWDGPLSPEHEEPQGRQSSRARCCHPGLWWQAVRSASPRA